jgi:hypothetical protein
MSKEKIGVVGAGLMGAEIALVYALAGHHVLLSDTSEETLAAAMKRLGTILDQGVTRGFYEAAETAPALARIATTTDLARFADRDAVTEAVFEDEAVKATIWRRLDAVCQPGCLFASNTSSIAISTLASYVGDARRRNFLGTHYFSPVSRMKLVEIIPAFETSQAAVETAMRLCRGAGKTPIRVKDVVGFAVNRVLHALCCTPSSSRRSSWSRKASPLRRTSTLPAASASATRSARSSCSTRRHRACRSRSRRFSSRPMANASARPLCSSRRSRRGISGRRSARAGGWGSAVTRIIL